MKNFKFFIIGKKALLCLGLAVCVAVFGSFCGVGWNKTLTTTATTKKLPIYCTENNKNQIAISFDAAWGNNQKAHFLKPA